MGFKNVYILFCVSTLSCCYATAQLTPVKKDSTRVYEYIQAYSKRHKVTEFIYHMIFKPIAIKTIKNEVQKKPDKAPAQDSYRAYEGKIIRNITITTLDPFGYSVTDSLVKKRNFMTKTGNILHIKSQNINIRNLLLIRKNQIFDSLLVKESERLIRSMGYVHDVYFEIKSVSKSSDSVDIYIRELDNWSIVPNGAISNTQFTINLSDKNFMGMGHESKNDFTLHYPSGEYALNTKYYIPNILNTYINATLMYSSDVYSNYNKGFAIDRPFFSAYARWAAGYSVNQQYSMDSVYSTNSVAMLQEIRSNSQDYWAGNAIQLFKGNTEKKRTTNFISAIRFLRVHYVSKPSELYDSLNLYTDLNFFMTSIGISTRKYIQDKYVFKFGVSEDIPYGKVFSITTGYQEKNNTERIYCSARITYGNYYDWGHFSTSFEYSTFFRNSQAEQGVFTSGINYFTPLFEIGRWKFRQFAKTHLTMGILRFTNENLSLNDGYGIDGFNSTGLTGTNRFVLTLQTQSYAPWNVIGFRFGPYLVCSLGMLSEDSKGFNKSKAYTFIGIGILMKNENLVFNMFQVSVSFYPVIPGNGLDIFKGNTFKTSDFGLRDYVVGKPTVMGFQ